MAQITAVRAREVLDSRGRPTVEVDVVVGNGIVGRAIVPSGASTGAGEALELRDGDPTRFGGLGVRRAVAHVNDELARVVLGRDVFDQASLDQAMIEADGTPNKARLGANAILGVSLAAARAAALALNKPLYRYLGSGDQLPVPMVNMISGGRHSENNLDMQDFLIIPMSAGSYRQALDDIAAVYQGLGKVLVKAGRFAPGVADEGGYGPMLDSHQEALDLLMAGIQAAGLVPGEDIAIALDVASSEFYKAGRYEITAEGMSLTAQEMVDLLVDWCNQYPIISIEDGVAEDDVDGWRLLTDALGKRVQLIGDDFFTTNPARLKAGIEQNLANAVLVKVNQIGTLTETLQVVEMAKAAGYLPVISARSGESEDPFIADLAVGTAAGQIKIGSITRSERTAKYNQLLRIEEELAADGSYRGRELFSRFLR